jgi:hypothetical protein
MSAVHALLASRNVPGWRADARLCRLARSRMQTLRSSGRRTRSAERRPTATQTGSPCKRNAARPQMPGASTTRSPLWTLGLRQASLSGQAIAFPTKATPPAAKCFKKAAAMASLLPWDARARGPLGAGQTGRLIPPGPPSSAVTNLLSKVQAHRHLNRQWHGPGWARPSRRLTVRVCGCVWVSAGPPDSYVAMHLGKDQPRRTQSGRPPLSAVPLRFTA